MRANLHALGEKKAPKGDFTPYASPEELQRDLDVSDRSLRQFNDDIIADDRLARIRSAVTTFGFHL